MRLVLCVAIAVGCGMPEASQQPPHRPQPVPPSAELSVALMPLAWMLGDWEGGHGTEHWIAANGALYGVAFSKDADFEVMIIDDGDGPGTPDGILRFLPSPSGASQVEFRMTQLDGRLVRFSNPAHDFPKNISYRLTGEGIAAEIYGDEVSGKRIGFGFKRGHRNPAPDLEAADRAFAADTARRGVAGWIAAFDANAGMLKQGKRIEGHAAIAELVKPLLEAGKLDWKPIASGTSGTLGFTVGKATFTGTKPQDSWRSSYVTIWRKTPAGHWKVWFDTGRIVNE